MLEAFWRRFLRREGTKRDFEEVVEELDGDSVTDAVGSAVSFSLLAVLPDELLRSQQEQLT